MFRNTPFASMPAYKLILGFSLCTLGGAMLYTYFKTQDDDNDKDEGNKAGSEAATAQSKSQNVPKEVCVKMVISNDHVPLIIGRGGANLKLIQERTNTKIRLRDKDSGSKYCDINGYPDAVKLASDLLTKEIQRAPMAKEELHVAQRVANKLNGRGGEIIHDISRKSLAKVSVDPNGRNNKAKITIIGNQKQVNIARKLIEDMMEEDEELRRDVEEVEHTRTSRRSPTNSINSSSMYSSQNSLSSHIPPREKLLASRVDEKPMEVYVSAVATPSKFWVQLVGPQSKKLDEMVQNMTDYYSDAENREKHVLKDPYVGQIVAGIFKYDDKWYRAEIVDIVPNKFNPNETVIDLYFVDYGDSEYVSPQDIYELRTDFLTLRFQAVECFLANVKSPVTSDPPTWQKHSIMKFEEFTEVANWKKLIARVVAYKERATPPPGTALNAAAREAAPLLGLELFDPTEGVDINIGHMLISLGFALPLEDVALPTHSRSYTPISNSSDSTIEEVNSRTTPTTPLSPMTTSLTDNNNSAAEDAHFEEQLKHLKQKNLYLNGNGMDEANAVNPVKLSADFHNGNTAAAAAAGDVTR